MGCVILCLPKNGWCPGEVVLIVGGVHAGLKMGRVILCLPKNWMVLSVACLKIGVLSCAYLKMGGALEKLIL
jgi:hypothetical protein